MMGPKKSLKAHKQRKLKRVTIYRKKKKKDLISNGRRYWGLFSSVMLFSQIGQITAAAYTGEEPKRGLQ